MHEARLVRFGAGKAHLGAALHALRVFVETLGLVLWHLSTAWLAAGTLQATVPQLESYGNQPDFALHTLEVFRDCLSDTAGRGNMGQQLGGANNGDDTQRRVFLRSSSFGSFR
jgi:hypothetical protein